MPVLIRSRSFQILSLIRVTPMNAAINSTNLSNLIRYVREHKSSGNDNVYGESDSV